jgi:proteasome accessory factor C
MAAKPRLQASDTVTLLLSLVPYLIEASPVSISEAAQNFGVSEKIIRDAVTGLTTLGVADTSGIPLHGEMFDIDWDEFLERDTIYLTHTVGIEGTPRLSAREAATLVAGLSLIEEAVNESNRALVAGLRQKVALGSSTRVADIAIVPSRAPKNLDVIREAIESKQHVRFDYRRAGQATQERFIDPLRIESVSGTWYVRGYCHLRDALRTFRADRMANVVLDPTPADTALTVNDLDEVLFEENETDIIATLTLPVWAVGIISDFGPRKIAEQGDDVTVEIRFATVENVYRVLSRRPGVITVAAPESLRQQVAAWASDAL